MKFYAKIKNQIDPQKNLMSNNMTKFFVDSLYKTQEFIRNSPARYQYSSSKEKIPKPFLF